MSEDRILLLYTDKFGEWARWNLDTGEFSYLPSRGYITDGWLSIVDERRVCFYRLGGKGALRLRIDDLEFTCDGTLSISVRRLSNVGRHVSIMQSRQLVYALEYTSKWDTELAFFDTTFAHEEDFDIFVFVRNVLGDLDWLQRIYRHNV